MRQEAFQHHLFLWIRHKMPCFIMSQSIQQQQRKTYSQSKSMSKEHAQDRDVDMGWSLISVFSRHLLRYLQVAAQDIQPDPQGTAGAQGLCAAASSSLPQHRHGHPSAHLTIPSCLQVQRGQKSAATTEVSAAETCSHSGPSSLGQREQDFWQC